MKTTNNADAATKIYGTNGTAILETSAFGSLPVVMFTNTHNDPPTREAWVCASGECARAAIAKLEAMPHITDVCATDAAVKVSEIR